MSDKATRRPVAKRDSSRSRCQEFSPCSTRNRLIIDPLGFLEALLIAFRELVACVSKPEKVTRGSFHPSDMPMIKTVGGQRSR